MFVDGRTDLYFGTGILQSYTNVSTLTIDPDSVFKHWDIRWVMWGKGSPLSVYLSHDPQWQIVDRTSAAIVFKHKGTW